MSSSPYREAVTLMNQVQLKHKSLKSLTFAKKSKSPCSKSAYAQVCNTLQHKSILDKILEHNGNALRTSIQMADVRDKSLVYILLYELLFGKFKSIRGGGKLKRNIMKFEKQLQETKSHIMQKEIGKGQTLELNFPRYVRVNTLKITVEEATKKLSECLTSGDVSDRYIYADPHVPALLVLSPKQRVAWHENELVKSGMIVLQDKSSCFSALALVHGRYRKMGEIDDIGDVIDACAAPGNKTSHVAALVAMSMSMPTHKKDNEKKLETKIKPCKEIFAFDRCSTRVQILQDRILKMAGKKSQGVGITPIHQDFLKVDPYDNKYKNVRSILLDPSCSGSGIVNNPQWSEDENSADKKKAQEQRIETLSNFQILALKHAMSFSQASRIVYSTCSIHTMENEHVVATSLKEHNETSGNEEMKWKVVLPYALKDWKRRGRAVENLTKDDVDCLIRVDGLSDNTNGFFVAYFERSDSVLPNDAENEGGHLTKLTDGVKGFYNGNFKVDEKEINCNDDVTDTSQSIIADKSIADCPQPKANATEKNSQKLAKKRAKKLAWKSKQRVSKKARLGNKNK